MKKRKLQRRKSSGRKQTASRPGHSRLPDLLAEAAASLRAGKPAEAEELCRRVLALDKGNSDACNLRGSAAAMLGRTDEARDFIGRALAAAPDSPVYNCNMGIVLANMGRAGEALAYFETALRHQPDNFHILYNLIELYEKTNRLSEMQVTIDRALALQPDSYSLRYQLAKLEFRRGRFQSCRQIATTLLQEKPGHDLQQKTVHLLAQVCDRLGLRAEAFAAFGRANRLLAATQLAARLGPLRRQYLQVLDLEQKIIAGEAAAPGPAVSASGQGPVFLIGFPRSGTTLAGQVLAGHSSITTLDEPPSFTPLVREYFTPDSIGSLASLPGEVVAAHRSRYLEFIREMAGTDGAGRVIIDKNPLYICYLELIRRFFADARIIVLHRDPRDVCLSCYMQDFNLNPLVQNFLNLEDTVLFYRKTMDLYLRHREEAGLSLLEVRYEDLVRDMQGEMERILSFVGQRWEEAMLSYARQTEQRYIRTPSYQQVVQPVSTNAVGRWRNYRVELAPYLEDLRPYVELLGFS